MAVCDACTATAVDQQTLAISDGPIYGLKPLRVCNWAAPRFGDAGVSGERAWKQAAMVAVATLNTIAKWKISKKQYDIAKEYANIAEDRWNRFKNDYMPFEKQFVFETAREPIYQPDYANARRQYGSYASSSYTDAQKRISDITRKYGLCMTAALSDQISLAEKVAGDDGTNYGYRDEERFSLDKQDIRWTRRSALLDLGRDLHATSATYAQAASRALAELGGLADQGAAGAMTALGYIGERREIADNASVTLNRDYGNNSLLYTGENPYEPY